MDHHRSQAAVGILYAEDFGVDLDPVPPPPASPSDQPELAPADLPPALTQADLDDACRRAVQVAEAAWSVSAAARRAETLAAIASELAGAQAAAAYQIDAVADGIARTVLSMLAGALPQFCRAHGDGEVRALVGRFAPLLARNAHLVVRVHPALIDAIGTDLAALDDSLAAQIELRPANLPPGDVRVAWEDGSLVRDTASICAVLQDGLAQLGLVNPVEHNHYETNTRSLEIAQ